MELVVMLLTALGLAVLAMRKDGRRYLAGQLPSALRPRGSLPPPSVAGHAVRTERMFIGPANDQSPFLDTAYTAGIDTFVEKTTVVGLLRSVVAFGWSRRERDGTPDRADLWLHLLFGPDVLEKLPEDGTLFAREGDLSFETEPSIAPVGSAVVVDLARDYLSRAPVARSDSSSSARTPMRCAASRRTRSRTRSACATCARCGT